MKKSSVMRETGSNKHLILFERRQQLERRLIPQDNCPGEMDQNMERRQEEARKSRREQDNQLESKLRDIQTMKEQEKQKAVEENLKRAQEQQRAEAHSR